MKLKLKDIIFFVQVTEEWIKHVYQGHIQPLKVDASCASSAEKYLAHSSPAPPLPWMRLTVKLWPKSQGILK
jgi:hypothetical protein